MIRTDGIAYATEIRPRIENPSLTTRSGLIVLRFPEAGPIEKSFQSEEARGWLRTASPAARMISKMVAPRKRRMPRNISGYEPHALRQTAAMRRKEIRYRACPIPG